MKASAIQTHLATSQSLYNQERNEIKLNAKNLLKHIDDTVSEFRRSREDLERDYPPSKIDSAQSSSAAMVFTALSNTRISPRGSSSESSSSVPVDLQVSDGSLISPFGGFFAPIAKPSSQIPPLAGLTLEAGSFPENTLHGPTNAMIYQV